MLFGIILLPLLFEARQRRSTLVIVALAVICIIRIIDLTAVITSIYINAIAAVIMKIMNASTPAFFCGILPRLAAARSNLQSPAIEPSGVAITCL